MNTCVIMTFKIQFILPQTMWISKGFVPVPGTARHETVKTKWNYKARSISYFIDLLLLLRKKSTFFKICTFVTFADFCSASLMVHHITSVRLPSDTDAFIPFHRLATIPVETFDKSFIGTKEILETTFWCFIVEITGVLCYGY